MQSIRLPVDIRSICILDPFSTNHTVESKKSESFMYLSDFCESLSSSFLHSFQMTSLTEENTILRSGLQIFADELEAMRTECTRLRLERDTYAARVAANERAAHRTITTTVTTARFAFENHVNAEKAKGMDCPILLSPLSDCASVTVSTTCGHAFDTTAFKMWNKGHCPVCRAPVSVTHTF